MTSEEVRPTGESNSPSKGDKPEVAPLAADGARGDVDGSPPVGMADIQATLALLEEQIAAYRRMLAEQEAKDGSETIEEDAEINEDASPLGEVDEEKLGTVAESIASDYSAFFAGLDAVTEVAVGDDVVMIVGEEIAEVKVEEAVGLAAPSVELPELFGELDKQLEMGLHRNASVAIYEDGQEYLAYLSSEDGSGVTPEPQPLFRVFSCGKAMAAAVIWRLLDTGILRIDAPVVEYWPEFAQRGKTGVTLRHVLTHTAGLPMDFGRADVDWGDWGRMSDILASMALEYEPGEVIHYHTITFGILVAEIASRASGIPFETLFDREVKSPLGLVDSVFSIEASDKATRNRVRKLATASDYHDREMPMNMDWLLDNQVVSPGATCITTANDLARLYATVCNNGVGSDGEVWLSEEAAANVFTTHASAYDVQGMTSERIGQGVWMFDQQPNRAGAAIGSSTFGHGGMGTSIAWGDPEHGISVAIITDTMQDEELNGRRLNRISAAVRRDLGLPVGSVAEF